MNNSNLTLNLNKNLSEVSIPIAFIYIKLLEATILMTAKIEFPGSFNREEKWGMGMYWVVQLIDRKKCDRESGIHPN